MTLSVRVDAAWAVVRLTSDRTLSLLPLLRGCGGCLFRNDGQLPQVRQEERPPRAKGPVAARVESATATNGPQRRRESGRSGRCAGVVAERDLPEDPGP